ncbi:DUF3396 domain-containing protein [Hyalangium sp.]|uniref:DUF3396 domain-containing protein n=1 Tax=Hyalangium sp. TaxID=2028555 RepID=UPI002D39C004|nr:DUF3396 domain-containing protein [Hyalangium sp.]HYH96082.1 DUF3396 domain-containing protein [Hyalangium sp.]
MSEHYPHIRIDAGFGHLMVREGLSLNFFLRCTHAEASAAVLHSLETYVRAVGPQALRWYADENGDLQELDETGWALTRRELREGLWPIVRLYETLEVGGAYRFEYYGKDRDDRPPRDTRDATCAMSFWLPTEFLEAQGPSRVRELALELAAPLPFCSGYGGLSFNGELDVVGVGEEIIPYCSRYPGIDLLDLETLGWKLGTRFRGPAWLTFLGPPLLSELGGPDTLRSSLHSPGTTVQELKDGRALVTLGQWPEAGDLKRGDNLPAYRELARILEPWLFHNPRPPIPCFSGEDSQRWERRFLSSA